MMQDDPDQYNDCAAVFKSGNKESGVYSLTIPDTKQQFKVTSINLIVKSSKIPAKYYIKVH